MSVRPPTSQRKTGQFSSRAEKIKALKERSRKLNPLSPTRKKIMQQIKKLEAASKPVPKKFTYTGKKIGDNKTKTGQFVPKPKVLSASDKRKIATKKREDKKKVQSSIKEQAKQLKIKAQDKKKAGDARVLESRAYKTKPRTFKDPYKKQVKKPATGVVTAAKKKPKPYADQKDKRPATGIVTAAKKKDKPKTKDISFLEMLKKGWTNLQNTPYGAKEIAESKTRAINKKMKEAPAYVKRMKEYKQISDMLKERQAKPTSKDIASGRDAEAKRKAAKLKRQAALEAKASPERPDRRTKPVSKLGRSPGALGGKLTTKKKVSSVVKPANKKVVKQQAPKNLAKVKPQRKPKPPVSTVTPSGAKRSIRRGRSPGELGGKIKQPISMSKAMSDRPESRGQRKDYDHFLKSRGGIEGFQFNLFGKNKTVAEASKAAKEAYDEEQRDRKRPGQSDYYQYGEGRRSQLKKGGMVKRNKGGAVRGVGQALRGFGNNSRYSNKMY